MGPGGRNIEDQQQVRRRIILAAPPGGADAERLSYHLIEVPGVLAVIVDPGSPAVEIVYDLTLTSYRALQGRIEASGGACSGSLWRKLQSSWFENLDRTGRDNVHSKPAACCNRPPRV